MALRNRALDPRGLESLGPIFKTLILSCFFFPNCALTTFDPYLLCWPQQVAPNAGLKSEGSPRANLHLCFSSVSRWVVSNSLRPHELQHARPPCPSPTPGVYSNSCPLSRWCQPTISSSVVPFPSCLQSFPASISQFFASGGQSISASASVLPMNIQDWFPLVWTGWISLQSRDSQESSPPPQFKNINSSALSFLYSPTLTSIHDY